MKIAQIGEQILRQPAEQVSPSTFSTAELEVFVEELLNTVLDANGVGIAAPQVFDSRAVMIIASRPNKRYPDAPEMAPLVLINPSVEWQSEHAVTAWEGCLSVPGLRGNIMRSDAVTVKYFNVAGETKRAEFEGFVARIFLHEYDHLIGKTWLDHVTSTEQVMAESVWIDQVLNA